MGNIKANSDVIFFGYRTNYIHFIFITNSLSSDTYHVSCQLKRLISCKTIDSAKYFCIGNIDGKDNLVLYFIFHATQLYINTFNSSLFNGYKDGYLYDTLNLTNKILCGKKANNIEVNCWLFNISSEDYSFKYTELPEISFETYIYYQEDCDLKILNSLYLFCCGGLNALNCFELDSDFNLINKNKLNFNGNISYVSIINIEDSLIILFTKTVITYKTNYTSYLYKYANLSLSEENSFPDNNFPATIISLYSSYKFFNTFAINSIIDNPETNMKTQLQEKIGIVEYLIQYYYKTEVNKGIDYEYKDNNKLYILSNIINQKNNFNKNKTAIDLEECGNILKNQVYPEIPQSESLYIIKIEANEDGMKIPKIEYGLYYPLYGKELIPLNISKCEGKNVDIFIPVSISDDIDKHNTSSDYYNNKCTKAKSEKGTDISLEDRKNEFVNKNMTLCEEDCSLVEYNTTTKKAKCSCKIKLNLPLVENIKFDKSKLFEQFTDISKIINIQIWKCYKSVFKGKGLLKNYGFYFYLTMIILFIICFIIFYSKSFRKLKKEIKKLVKCIKLSLKKENNLDKSIDDNKSKKSRNISEKRLINIEPNKLKRKKRRKKDKANKREKNITEANTEIKNKLKKTKKKNKNMVKFTIEDVIQNNQNKYNDTELNSLNYEQALLYDKRTYFQYYFSLLKINHLLIFSFYCNSNDYNSQIIKIFLFFFFLSVHLFINALFFNDDTIHRIYEDEGDFNFVYQLPQIIYSSLISTMISTLIKFLSLSENGILELKNIKGKKEKKEIFNNLIKNFIIKFALFFIISFLLLVLFFYYVTCFCGVYVNSQFHLFNDSFISFATSFIYPFGIYLIPGIFRMIAIHEKGKKCFYKFSQLIQNI